MTSPTQGEHAQPAALRTIAEWPISDPGNMDAVNMAAVARAALTAAQPVAQQGAAYAELPAKYWLVAGEVKTWDANYMRDFADRTHALRTQQPAPAAAAEEIATLRALSVTNIMLNIVPGLDGMGHEVYAKSVKDVEEKLSAMGQELEDWQLGIRRYQPSPTPQADSQPAPVWGATPGEWYVRKLEKDGVLKDCFVAAPDFTGCAYDAEILGDDEYRSDVLRKLADCELIVAAVKQYRAARAPADSQPAKAELFNPLEGGNPETALQMAAVIALRDSQPAPVRDESAARDECKRKWLAEDEDCNLLEAYDRGWKDRAARAPADGGAIPAYSIDADPQGIRARVADAISGALAQKEGK